MNEERSPLFLALDCGEIAAEEVLHYETAPAYKRASSVWQAIYNQVMGAGGYVSTRTMMNYGHFYCVSYADAVPRRVQLQVFHIMDRFRQEYQAYHSTFVQFPDPIVQDLFEARAKAIREKNPVAYSISASDIGELYETHTPRVMVHSESEPVPIVPPFESIPLYYEKQETGVQQPKASARKSFLERYLTSLRLDYEQEEIAMRKLEAPASTIGRLTAVGQAMILATLESRKYRFTHSAMAMARVLMGEGTHIKTLPDHGMLIEFPEPLRFARIDPVAGFAFMQPFMAYQRWVQEDRGRREKIFGKLVENTLAHLWGVNALAEDGGALINLLYDDRVQRWRVPEVRQCLVGECVRTMSPEEKLARGVWTNWQLCPTCQGLLDFFSRWIPVALLMIEGEFAEEQEQTTREVEEVTTYKEKRPGSGKYDEKRQKSRWHIVSFDASVKKPVPVRSTSVPGESEESPSRVELGIAAGTLFWMNIELGRVTRHLVPGPSKPWKTEQVITVAPHPTKVVVTLETLQKRVQRVTKVTASRYEEERKEGEGAHGTEDRETRTGD